MIACRGSSLTLYVLFNVAFLAFIVSSSSSSADVTGFFAFAFLFFSLLFSFVFILFLGITVAFATGSKSGISTHLVPSELKLDGGGEGVSVRVRVCSRGGECAPLVVDPDQPSACEVELGNQPPEFSST